MRELHLGKINLHLKIEIEIQGEILPKSNKESRGILIRKLDLLFRRNMLMKMDK